MLLVVILVTTVLLLGRHKQKRGICLQPQLYILLLSLLLNCGIYIGVTVTDHIPVDDNPVYITMKRIHMNKNTAYEVVHLKTKMN